MKIINVKNNKENYNPEHTNKTQICIGKFYPHSVHFMIDREGNVFKYVPEKNWVNHFCNEMDQHIIFIGIESHGALLQYGDSFFPAVFSDEHQKFIPGRVKGGVARFGERITNDGHIAVRYVEEICSGYKNFRFFERYTDKTLTSLHELLEMLTEKLKIKNFYQGDKFWNHNSEVIAGKEGIFSDSAFNDDPYPYLCNRLIDVLKNINK